MTQAVHHILVALDVHPNADLRLQTNASQSIICCEDRDQSPVINEYDLVALEKVLQLAEAMRTQNPSLKTLVHTLTVTTDVERAASATRTAYAMGADQVHIASVAADFSSLNASQTLQNDSPPVVRAADVAKAIVQTVKQHKIDSVWLGMMSPIYEGQIVPALVADELKWPLMSNVISASIDEVESTCFSLQSHLDAQIHVCQLQPPFIAAVELRIAEPRFVSLPQMIRARQKQFDSFNILPVQSACSEHLNPIHRTKRSAQPITIEELTHLLKL